VKLPELTIGRFKAKIPIVQGGMSVRVSTSSLAAAVAGLAALDREVLSLRFEGELELPQLAATLGVPLPTAKARLYRALARLRERLLARSPAEEWR